MSDALISFAVQKLGDALIQKVVFLRGVEDEVQWLKDELQSMQCFLKDAAEKQGSDERIRKWISDVREVAQDAEDAIDIYILKDENQKKIRCPMLARCPCFPFSDCHVTNRVGKEMKSIRSRLDDISRRRERYGIGNLGEGTETSRRRSEDIERWRRLSPLQKDKHLVGFKEDVAVLLQRSILTEKKGLSVAAIVGMGGIGKSTLAKKLYNHAAVAARFERRAWVVVSSKFTAEDIIKQIMMKLQISISGDNLRVLESMKDKLRREEMLQQMLREELVGKKYFIVLDDVWEHTDWESLRGAFPEQQDEGSRLLLTSRNQIIREHEGYIHKMRLLNPDESWELLLKTSFLGKTDEEKCPEELEDIGREILKKCQGLPLAITVAGGMLANQRESRSGWEKILKQIKSYHLGTSEIGNNVQAILELSYQNLRPELQACFMYLGFFKEDAAIRAKRLVHLWVAQGFVKQEGEETMEEIAIGYLDELINRNLVQVKEMKRNKAKTCQMHDLLRDLSIRKAMEELSFDMVNVDFSTGTSTSTASQSKARHLAIYYNSIWELKTITKFPSLVNQRRLRSLLFHQNGRYYGTPPYLGNFELLRVLDFEDFSLDTFPESICTLIALRYLGLRRTNIGYLPRSLANLKNLEVLDAVVNTTTLRIPDVIWKLQNLRHVYLSHYMENVTPNTEKILESLKNLETLDAIDWRSWMRMKHPEQMTSLRKLAISTIFMEWNSATNFFTSLAMLPNLTCLKLTGSYWGSHNFRYDQLQRLTKLKLCCLDSLPNNPNLYPPNLSCLKIIEPSTIRLNMDVLENLPNLVYLKLEKAHNDEMIVVSANGFPKLRVLSLHSMSHLRNFKVVEGGMPELQRLEIAHCSRLKIENLQEELRAKVAV